MLALESFYGGNGYLEFLYCALCIGRHVDDGNLLTVMDGVGVRTVEHHMNAEGTFATRGEPEVEHSAVTFLCATESLHALGVLSHSAKTEIFEADDAAVGDTCEIHVVVPVVPSVLHPVVARQIAGNTGRIVLVGIETENLEAFTGHFGTRIFVAVAGLGRPFVVLGKRVVANDAHLAALSHGLFVPFNLDGCHHRLAGIAETTGRTVIEHIPLTVDFLQRTVGVVCGIGGDEVRAVLIGHHTA